MKYCMESGDRIGREATNERRENENTFEASSPDPSTGKIVLFQFPADDRFHIKTVVSSEPDSRS